MAFDPTLGITALSAVTFTLGLLIGVVAKRTLKLAFAIVSLVVLLAVTGYVNLALNEATTATILRVFYQAPALTGRATEIASALPLSSAAFLIGVTLGFWKG
ncbi:MAG TPA: FUN14 domain-containing protein [Candidatus Bathyarchaeia archaeon]